MSDPTLSYLRDLRNEMYEMQMREMVFFIDNSFTV